MLGVEQVLRFVKFTIKYPNKKKSQIIFISSNLFQLFKERRIKNQVPIQKELARLLLKGLYLLKYDSDLIFNTG